MNIAQAMQAGAVLGLDRLDVQLLILNALGRNGHDRAWLLAHDTDAIPEPVQLAFIAACDRRARGEPLAYIVGRKEFFGLDLQVDARVLVPRPDTETLVEWALEVAGDRSRVIDLGTGSGAIALAIKKQLPGATVEAVDSSSDALDVAIANAHRLGLDVGFREGSWLRGTQAQYDLIVSNPPYIASGDPHLAALRSEPREALESGPDGLGDIRAIVAQAPPLMRPGGWLLLEHGWDQGPAVRAVLQSAGFRSVSSRRDLGGNERCTGAQWLETGIIGPNV